MIDLRARPQDALRAVIQFLYTGFYTISQSQAHKAAIIHAQVFAEGVRFELPLLRRAAADQLAACMNIDPALHFKAAYAVYANRRANSLLRTVFVTKCNLHLTRILKGTHGFHEENEKILREVNGLASDISLNRCELIASNADVLSLAKNKSMEVVCKSCEELAWKRQSTWILKCPECWSVMEPSRTPNASSPSKNRDGARASRKPARGSEVGSSEDAPQVDEVDTSHFLVEPLRQNSS